MQNKLCRFVSLLPLIALKPYACSLFKCNIYIISLRSVISNACQHSHFCQLLLISLSLSSVIFEERGEKEKKIKGADLSKEKLFYINSFSVKLTQV